jgi:hypothetical protein
VSRTWLRRGGWLLAIVGAQDWTGVEHYLGTDMFSDHLDTRNYWHWANWGAVGSARERRIVPAAGVGVPAAGQAVVDELVDVLEDRVGVVIVGRMGGSLGPTAWWRPGQPAAPGRSSRYTYPHLHAAMAAFVIGPLTDLGSPGPAAAVPVQRPQA